MTHLPSSIGVVVAIREGQFCRGERAVEDLMRAAPHLVV